MRIPQSRRGRLIALAILACVIGLGYFLYKRYFPDFEIQDLLNQVADFLGSWTYLLVGLASFLETGAFVGLVVPGETLLLIGGAVAGQGVIDIYLLIAIAWLCAFAGDSTSFILGRRLGRAFLIRHGPRFGVSSERFEQVEEYFDRHGGKTVLIGRFVGLVRAISPFIAGTSGMRFRSFAPYSVLGAGIQVSVLLVLGYLFSRSLDVAAKYAGQGAFLLGLAIAVIVAIVVSVRFLRERENRRRLVRWMEGHAVGRPFVALARRFSPQLRFIGDRLTPGGTFGLEATTVLAVLAVAVFVLVSYIVIVGGDPAPTPGDGTAADVADALRTGWLVTVAKGVTFLGSGAVVLPVVIAVAIVLAMGGHRAELAVLVVAFAITVIGYTELKDLIARPRPPDPIASFSGYSFPSGHAASSAVYAWLGVTVAIRLRPNMARAALVVGAGIVLSALIGLSRVYLGVHYLSDVTAGWALGATSFALCSLIAMVVVQLRQNPGVKR